VGRLAAWHLPGGPVGPPATWAGWSTGHVGCYIKCWSRANDLAR